jgi:hypothetical protein
VRAGIFFGILGVLVSLSVAAFALLVYVVNGTTSPGNPHASRVAFGVAAFALALLPGIGASLLRARPDVGSLLMLAGSVGGTLAMSAFNAGAAFWYAGAVPLCLLGAFLALRAAASSPSLSITLLRALVLLLLVAGVVAGFALGGAFGAVVFAVPLLIAGVLTLTGSPARSYPQYRG